MVVELGGVVLLVEGLDHPHADLLVFEVAARALNPAGGVVEEDFARSDELVRQFLLVDHEQRRHVELGDHRRGADGLPEAAACLADGA
jgi:hypothetical protein